MIVFDKLFWQLTELENAQGTKAKEALLQKYVDDPGFAWMVKMALDQGHSFGIEEIPDFILNLAEPNDDRLIEYMESLKSSAGVSDEFKAKLFALMMTSRARYIVCSRILRRDLRCGVQAKTINKVRTGLIFKVPYQRCGGADRINKKMRWPAMVQVKANGMFVYILPTGDFMTRKGNRFTIPGCTIHPFLKGLPDVNQMILMGELLVLDEENMPLPRAISNGYINSFIKGEGDDSVASRVVAEVWNWVTPIEFRLGSSQRPYNTSFTQLQTWLPVLGPDKKVAPVQPITTTFASCLEDAQRITNGWIAGGLEGSIVKSMAPEFVWRDESSSDYQIKLKAEAEAEFRIIDTYLGEKGKKYEKVMGGIVVESACGKIVSKCGGGLSDKIRELGLPVGAIATIKFNGITDNEDLPGKHALDHPRFVEIRLDKDEADTLEYCQLQLKGGLK